MYNAIKQLNPITSYLQQAENDSDKNQTVIAIFIPIPVAPSQAMFGGNDMRMPRYGSNPEWMSNGPMSNGIPPPYYFRKCVRSSKELKILSLL